MDKRRCRECQAILSSYNDKDICGACEPPDYNTRAHNAFDPRRTRVCGCGKKHQSTESTECKTCREKIGVTNW